MCSQVIVWKMSSAVHPLKQQISCSPASSPTAHPGAFQSLRFIVVPQRNHWPFKHARTIHNLPKNQINSFFLKYSQIGNYSGPVHLINETLLCFKCVLIVALLPSQHLNNIMTLKCGQLQGLNVYFRQELCLLCMCVVAGRSVSLEPAAPPVVWESECALSHVFRSRVW